MLINGFPADGVVTVNRVILRQGCEAAAARLAKRTHGA